MIKSVIKYILLFYFLNFRVLMAQNLIPNPGFEEKEIKSYDKTGGYFRAKDWEWIQPRGEYAPWMGMHVDSTMTPSIEKRLNHNKIYNFTPIYPYQGSCYFRSIGCKFKNVIQAKLTKPLSKGVVYYFEMYYRIGAEKVDKYIADPFLINHADFGAFFTNKNFFNIVSMADLYHDKIKIKPLIPVKSNDSTPLIQWTKFTAYFIPQVDYNYILLGNFTALGQHNPKVWQGIAEFYIDNLILTPYENIFLNELQNMNKPLVLQGIYFTNDQSTLTNQSFYTLNILYNYMKCNPNTEIEIDCYMIKKNDNNLLSKQRAGEVAKYLINRGISPQRLHNVGYQDSIANNPNPSLIEQSKINRVEIIIKQKK